jgi:hypothetical protein
LRLAFFFGFVGLRSEILRIMSSNRDGCFCGGVFNIFTLANAADDFKFWQRFCEAAG